MKEFILELVKNVDCQVIGIGFDATCSLVLLDKDANGVALDCEDDEVFDVILWAREKNETLVFTTYFSLV